VGVLSDLVVAPSGDADRIARAAVPSQEFGGIDIKGIDTVKLCMLHALVTDQPYKTLKDQYTPVVSVSDEGPWVFRLPDSCVDALARLDDEARAAVATRWAQTKEFQFDRWRTAAVAEALEAISALARRAVESKQSVFLWMHL